MNKKSFWKSKTVISQLIMSTLAIAVPGFRGWIAENPEAAIVISSIVTILMRVLASNIKIKG